jgi:hypothetical protein
MLNLLEVEVIVNPDSFISQLMRGNRVRERYNDRHRKRRGKILLCLSCVLGQHPKCSQGDCPCPHSRPD